MQHQKRKAADGEDVPFLESWSRTEANKIKARHKWTICDFLRRSQAAEVGDSICSPPFTIKYLDQGTEKTSLFQLEAFPNGEEGENNDDYVAVFLTCRKCPGELHIKYEFCVEKVDGTHWSRIGNATKKFNMEQSSWGYGKAFQKELLRTRQNELLPNGELTIVCNMEISFGDKLTSGETGRMEYKRPKTQSLGKQLTNALDMKNFSDVTLICGDRRFYGHKCILAARSDVFAAMFSFKQAQEEGKSNEVEVKDLTPEILDQTLRFIYTDDCDVSAENAGELLTAADMYNIPGLKAMAEEFLCNNINLGNFDKILVLSFLHEAKQLKDFVVHFIWLHLSAVTGSPGWKVINQDHPQIIAEFFASMVAKKK